MLIAGGGVLLLFILSKLVPALDAWPRDFEINPAQSMNDGLSYFIVNFRKEIETIKTVAFFFIMLPAKIGLQGSISPFTWGFELQTWHSVTYALVMMGCDGIVGASKSIWALLFCCLPSSFLLA